MGVMTALFSTACVSTVGKKIRNINLSTGYTVNATKVRVKGKRRACYWRIDHRVGAETRLLAWVCRHGKRYHMYIVNRSTTKAGILKDRWKKIIRSRYLTYEDDLDDRYARGSAQVGPDSPDYYKGLDAELMPMFIYVRGDLKVTRLYREVFKKKKK